MVQATVLAKIGRGLLILLGIGHSDGPDQAQFLADKISDLRIFEDAQGKTNLSILDVGGEALVVSQFTLYADVDKGRRPSFTDAAPPEQAEPLVDRFASRLRERGIRTSTGAFGEHMSVDILNDGPFTIWLER